MFTREDIVWFAGLFEGEGCLAAVNSKDKQTLQWRMSVNMTDQDVMEHIHSIFGGNLYYRKSTNTRHKDKWVWTANNKLAYALCAAMWPFMGERRRVKIETFMKDFNSRPANNSERVKQAWKDGKYANRAKPKPA